MIPIRTFWRHMIKLLGLSQKYEKRTYLFIFIVLSYIFKKYLLIIRYSFLKNYIVEDHVVMIEINDTWILDVYITFSV